MEALVNYSLITNEISLVRNNISGEAFTVDPQLHRKIDSIDDSKIAVTYELDIKNTEDHPFPLDIKVSMTGVFDVSKLEKEKVDDFIKIQSCQILFPQIRTIVATLTASAFVQPILLPVVDARKLLSDK